MYLESRVSHIIFFSIFLVHVQTVFLATNAWSTVTTTNNPSGRMGHSAVITSDDKMIVFGGTNEAGTYYNNLYSYDHSNSILKINK